MNPVGALRRLFAQAPEESLLQTGGDGELIIARARIILTGSLLALAGLAYLRTPESAQSRIHLAGGLLAVPLSLLIFLMIRRAHYRWWMGLTTTLFDVTMVSAALSAFLIAGNPHAALNSQMVFPLYFLALSATTIRLDHRACAIAGLAAVVQYAAIVLIAQSVWDMNAPQYAPFTYGTFDIGSQGGRIVILGAMGWLGTLVNLRMQKPHILSAADSLTGMMNRRTFEERWQGEVARSRRYGRPISIAAIDIDYFKQFNDTYGHAAGDAALQSVGRVLRSRIRAGDFAARMGGEEFVVALPETNSVNAVAMAEHLRKAIAETPIRVAGHRGSANVTISIGVASWPEHGEEITRLLERADNRLYEAKLAGRDQVRGPGGTGGGAETTRPHSMTRVKPV
ncbi:MAG: GGDEF domain-containing protein [Candidatus Palauibacterales bacterium]|nr:GGDEF domain-containing protein [Candidatus Palauibacterales bacterium]MDP2483234.1 GGDEF domain-containing protein [Candidatus Palauibacterales bacterium]